MHFGLGIGRFITIIKCIGLGIESFINIIKMPKYLLNLLVFNHLNAFVQCEDLTHIFQSGMRSETKVRYKKTLQIIIFFPYDSK